MRRGLIASWLGLIIILSFVVIVIEIAPRVEAPMIIYVDDNNGGFEDGSLQYPYNTIQEGVDAASPGDTVFVFNGFYIENVIVNKTINLTGEDRNTTIIDSGGSDDAIIIKANWVNITGFTMTNGGSYPSDAGIEIYPYFIFNTIFGNNILSNKGHGVHILVSSYNTIIDNDISNNDYGIFLHSTSNNNITNNNISNNRFGIYLSASSYNTIIDNNISNNDKGIFLASSSNHSITNNNISNNGNGIYLSYSSNNNILYNYFSSDIFTSENGNILDKSSNTILTDNNFINDGILITGDQLFHFNSHTIPDNNNVNGKPLYYYKNSSGVNIDGIPVGQLILANCSDFDVRNLRITNTCAGIEVAFSTDIIITNNNVSSNTRYGIFLRLSSYNHITHNTVFSNGDARDDCGIFLDDALNNYIGNNYVLSNNRYGIWLYWSLNNTIENNNILNNFETGIYFQAYSSNNTISNNIISSNLERGIFLRSSSNNRITNNFISKNLKGIHLHHRDSNNNTITDNIVLNNTWGIALWSPMSPPCFDNIVYHNNIIGNTNQAYDDTNNGNQWDNGYPSGGNYWSDFDEEGENAYDDYNGSNQNVLGSDGIVDLGPPVGGKNPYIIDPDSQDNYPLINPLDNWPPTITNLQPPHGSVTNDNTPLIGADYNDLSGIDIGSIILEVDGINVTSIANVTTSCVSYIPGVNLSDGVHTVYLEVRDNVGNHATVTWTFTVVTALAPPMNLTTKVVNNGNNIELEWDPSPSPAMDHYLIYRADSAMDFDFTEPYIVSTTWSDPKNTTWIDPDPGVTAVDGDFYYIVRAAIFNELDISLTSNTAGVWTRTFQAGTSTFSLPLEPYEMMDTEFHCQDMNASYIKWMNQTTHTWMYHEKGSPANITFLEVGKGYVIGFEDQTCYSFCGMPGAMIQYDEAPFGFDADPFKGNAKNITALVDPLTRNVNVTWERVGGMVSSYQIYNSTKRNGFWGVLGKDYHLLGTVNSNTLWYAHEDAARPGATQYYMVFPIDSIRERGTSSYSIGVWTGDYDTGYDTFALPLKLNTTYSIDWYCDAIDDTWGMNYYNYPEQRWMWHKTIMPEGIYDTNVVMAEGYQVSTTSATKFTFVGV